MRVLLSVAHDYFFQKKHKKKEKQHKVKVKCSSRMATIGQKERKHRADFLACLGHLYGKCIKKIGLKAP